MTGIVMSTPAAARLAQRTVSASDLDWALQLGREVDDGLLVLDKDTEAAARELERQAQRIRRLSGLRVVRDGDRLITVYAHTPPNRSGGSAAPNGVPWRTDQCPTISISISISITGARSGSECICLTHLKRWGQA